METTKRIATVIIDDDKEAIFALQSYLELMPEVELKGTAISYQKAIKLINEQMPDLIFLDIEMPGKTGFELLQELGKDGVQRHFKVIFHTAYDKYTIQALREAAFDFLLKPPRENELKEAIQRYLQQRSLKQEVAFTHTGISTAQMVAFPTNKGLHFLAKAEIVYVECQKSAFNLRPSWSVVLNNHQTIKLRSNTCACAIINYLGADSFIQLSQSVIVNIAFVNMIEYKTHYCYLYPPFDDKPVKISRKYLSGIQDKFDLI